MSDKKVWLVTGAGRGMGVDLAKAALAAGHAVVATGRNTDTVRKALGEHDDLLAAELDVTSPASAETAVAAAVERFGRIDVLVNNAGNFYAGYFEGLTPAQIDAQLAATLLGPMNVTRALLPVMRKQRSGHIVTITSTAGIVGGETTLRLRRSEVRRRRLDGVARSRGRSIRDQDDPRRARLLPHPTPRARLDNVRRAFDRRLRHAQGRKPCLVGVDQRQARRRPGQARRRARADPR